MVRQCSQEQIGQGASSISNGAYEVWLLVIFMNVFISEISINRFFNMHVLKNSFRIESSEYGVASVSMMIYSGVN